MSNMSGSFDTEVISLREALRRVVRHRGDFGERTVERWDSLSLNNLTPENYIILDNSALFLLRYLRSGILTAMHRPSKIQLMELIEPSVWLCCNSDEVYWHVSAIRAQPYQQMLEDIVVSSESLDHLMSQSQKRFETSHVEIEPLISRPEIENKRVCLSKRANLHKKSPEQEFVLEIVRILFPGGDSQISKLRRNIFYRDIQVYAEKWIIEGKKAKVPSSDIIRRAMGWKI